MIAVFLRLCQRGIPAADARLIASLTAERDQAYQAGYASGFVDGLEAGLRESLDDARTAIGRSA